MATGPSACRSCGASIFWLAHNRTGNLAPVNAAVDPAGNIVLNLALGTYELVPRSSDDARDRHTNHFVTCPQARKWGPRP